MQRSELETPATVLDDAPNETAPRVKWPSALPTERTSATALASAAAALLAACGGGGGATSTGSGTGSSATGGAATGIAGPATFNNYPAAASDQEAARFVLQAQLAVTDADIAAVRTSTYTAWLKQQYAAPLGQTGWDWLESKGYGVVDANSYFFNNYPADFMIWNQLFTSTDALRKRVALALSEIFVVSLTTADFDWRSHGIAAYWDVLVKNAFGNFRQLLEDITLNPAMGYFLNTKGNQKENVASGRQPDENYAREVMQLFTIGLYQLNLDGTEKTDASGNKIESYTQSDVSNLARVFTGYDFDTTSARLSVPGQTYTINPKDSAQKPMKLTVSNHSTLAATFLGTTVAANTAGAVALKTALDTLFNHPNTAPFFCKQLIQRMVTSSPSPAYVARVSAAFVNNGSGVRGDISAVLSTLLLDDEARSPAGTTSTGFGKLREPMLRFVQWGRSFGIASAAGSWKLFDTSAADTSLGQSPLRSPSVFNFFRPGYVPPGTALASTQTPAPEFQLVNETSNGGYLNYMQNTIRSGLSVPSPLVPQAAYTGYVVDVACPYTKELALVNDPAALVARLNLVLSAGQLSAATQSTIVTAISTPSITASSSASQKLDRVCAAVLLVMASSEYLIQK